MTEIIKTSKYTCLVNVNGRLYRIDNEDVQSQLVFMEKVIPAKKECFSFAQFFEPVPKLEQL